MAGTGWGLLGAGVGIVAATAAVLVASNIRRPHSAAAVDQPGLPLGQAFRSDGVERYVYMRAAAWSFPAVLVAVGIIGALSAALHWTNVGQWIFGAVWGIAGLAFGLASALFSRRMG